MDPDNSTGGDGEERGGSPPCLLDELDPTVRGYADDETARDVSRWRKAERERLLAARMGLSVEARQAASLALAEALETRLGGLGDVMVALYWPFRGEPDLRPWAGRQRRHGVRFCLPVVVEKARPLVFRHWAEGAGLVRGVWNIPIPDETAAEVRPDLLIAPVVGADGAGFRLGYGGGYYDRTLAALHRQGHRPPVIGVGYEMQKIATIFPQPHDVPMTGIVLVAP